MSIDKFIEFTCPVCGKPFIVADREQWVYLKRTTKKRIYLCSWHCLRAEERGKRGGV